MKCQKCGAQMVPGHLYCDICGAEYQIVPDFEPEIENSIAKSMSEVSEIIEEDKQEKEAKITSIKELKVPSFGIILLIVLICSLFVYLGYHKYTHSTNYQNKQAIAASNKKDYYKAAQIYESIRKKNPQDAYWYIKEAEIKLLLEDAQKAYHLAVSAIQLDENTDMAYDFLLSYLEKEKNYIEMNQYLKACNREEIRDKYWEYLCEVPSPVSPEGSYSESLEFSFDRNFEGTIYYTLDGSIPNTQSFKYEKPFKLGNGTHIITAIYENTFGMISEPFTFKYMVSSDTPLAPVVNLSSGKYSMAQMIEINVEEGTKVFYTTDLSQPTNESTEYTAPIPMPLGESRFNFIAYSSKGIAGEVTQRNYMLNMKTNVTLEEAEVMLVQKLIATGHILDKNGAVKDRYGVFRYFYKFPISEADMNYYVFEEHYMENQINNPLNHFYAVDVLMGSIYKLIPDGAGNFTRVDF